MDVSETRIDELTRQFRVAVPAADIERRIEEKLRELSQTLRLPGFRPGKVPASLLRKRYADAVRMEVLETAISETSQAVINERGLRPAVRPDVHLADAADGEGLAFTMAVEELPEITPPDFAQLAIERLVADVDEDDVNKTLQHLARELADSTPVTEARGAGEGDVVIFDIVAPEDRTPFGDGKAVPMSIGGGSELLPGMEQQLLGAAVGERRTLSIAFPDDFGVAEVAGREVAYEIEVRELRHLALPAMDDAFAQSLGFDTLAELQERIRAQHADRLAGVSRAKAKRLLLDQLDSLYDFPVPKSLVNQEFQSLVRAVKGEAQPSEDPAATAAPSDDHGPDHGHGHGDEGSHHAHDHEAEAGHVHGPGCGHADHHEDEAEPVRPAAADAVGGDVAGGHGASADEEAEYLTLARRRVRLGLLLADIGRRNDVRVTPDELNKAVVAEIRRFPGQEKEVLEFFRKHPEAREALSAPILEEKVVDLILARASVTERKVSAADLLRESAEEPTSAAGKGAEAAQPAADPVAQA
jgi:trigger factor